MKKRKRGRRSSRPDKKTFEKEYYDLTINLYDLATKYNVSIWTIYRWAKEFNQEINT